MIDYKLQISAMSFTSPFGAVQMPLGNTILVELFSPVVVVDHVAHTLPIRQFTSRFGFPDSRLPHDTSCDPQDLWRTQMDMHSGENVRGWS